VLARIDGRARNLMSMPDGSRRWPGCELIDLDGVPGIRGFQLVQAAIDRLELHVVAARPLGPEDDAKLEAAVRASLGHGFDLAVLPVEQLPHAADGRFEPFVNRVGG
jgi:phenylacetate-CoA ligase